MQVAATTCTNSQGSAGTSSPETHDSTKSHPYLCSTLATRIMDEILRIITHSVSPGDVQCVVGGLHETLFADGDHGNINAKDSGSNEGCDAGEN